MLTSIRYFIKERFDAIANTRLKQNILNALPFWVGAFVTGLVAVLYAKLFFWAEQGTLYVYEHGKWGFFILTPACFVLAWWLVQKLAPLSRGSGIPQVSAAVELAATPKKYALINSLLSVKVLVVKIISSMVMVLGGGVIGREGPTIQIAGSIFKKINDWLPDWYPKISKRNMLVTGAASGLAAAFNTPLGGIVFAIEELTKTHFNYFKSALLAGVIIAGLTALNILGPYLYLGYPQMNSGLSLWIVLPVLAVAVVSGFSGGYMGKSILYIAQRKKSLRTQTGKVLFVVVCGLLVAAMGVLMHHQAFGSGKEIMQETLFTNDKYVAWYMPILRFVGPIISFSTGAAGGVFAPSLTAGASIGSYMASIMHLSAADANLVILCGMVAFLTGITRSPFTSSILVLEMTNSHNIIFYLMLSGLVASLVATIAHKHAFYEHLKEQYVHEVTEEAAIAAESPQKA